MDKRYQVFVSSTYRDLQEERREVIQALLELDCLPAGMEMFPAASDDQWTLIKQVIDQSDYYVVVLGGKYGSLTEDGVSYTEQEFDYAVSTGMQILGFVPDDPGKLEQNKIELDPDLRAKLNIFQDKVMQRHVKKYRGPDDLGAVVSRGLSVAMKQHPAVGWVRGTFAMTPEKEAEVSRLRELLSAAELRESRSQAVAARSVGLEQGSDRTAIYYTMVTADDPSTPINEPLAISLTWDEILLKIGMRLMLDNRELTARNNLGSLIHTTRHERGIGKPNCGESLAISHEQWALVLFQLNSLGLIDALIDDSTTDNYYGRLQLTENGRERLIRLLSLREKAGDHDDALTPPSAARTFEPRSTG